MKRKGMCFLAGALSSLALILPSASALASDSSFTITVHPIDILVNGEVFRPEDANGNSVMTFTYNGTSYAPVRALAEEYGLEVGYDPARNTATVSSPTASVPTPNTAEDFASQWTVAEKPVTNYGDEKIFTAKYSGSLGMSEFKEWWKSMSEDDIRRGAEALAAEYQELIAFGDFSYYNIGDRGTRSFAELKELFAGNGMVGFVAKERVDGKLVLPEAVQLLAIKASTAAK